MKMQVNIIIVIFFISSLSLLPNEKWRKIDSSKYSLPNMAIDCYDSLNCVVVGNENMSYPYVKITSDGGETWKTILHDTIIRDSNGKVIWSPKRALDISYPDSNLIFLLCDFGIYWYSTTQGQSWDGPINLKTPEYLENWTYFKNSKEGGFTTDNKCFVTYDGCKSFKVLNITDSIKPLGIDDLFIQDSNNIILLGYYSSKERLYTTTNGGLDWDLLPTPPLPIRRILFFDSLNGFGYGGYRVDTQKDKDVVLKTTNGGLTWEIKLDSLMGSQYKGLHKMSFDKERKNGIAIGYNGKVDRTTDYGNSWFYDNSYGKETNNWPADAHQITSKRFIILSQDRGDVWEYNEDGFTSVDESLNILDYFLISPNPSSNYVNISLDNHNLRGLVVDIRIYDLLGVELYCGFDTPTEPLSLEDEKVRLDVSQLAPGIYFIRVGDKVQKFVKL